MAIEISRHFTGSLFSRYMATRKIARPRSSISGSRSIVSRLRPFIYQTPIATSICHGVMTQRRLRNMNFSVVHRESVLFKSVYWYKVLWNVEIQKFRFFLVEHFENINSSSFTEWREKGFAFVMRNKYWFCKYALRR